MSLMSSMGCGGPKHEVRSDFTPPLIAYAGPSSDVAAAGPVRANPIIRVEQIPAKILRDPQKVMAMRLWMERQIVSQTRDISDQRYQRLVRPSLARKLLEAGLPRADVDGLLRGVDESRRK